MTPKPKPAAKPRVPKLNIYRCPGCGKTVERDSAKAWIKSMCVETGEFRRLTKQPKKGLKQ